MRETPLDLETTLQWTLTRNPGLLTLRRNRAVSAAAWAVARQFPMSINPTVSVDLRPWTFEGGSRQPRQTQIAVSWMQPLEFGHRRYHRALIGRANYSRTTWEIAQAELLAMVQTYRLHQTALYRLEKLRLTQKLAQFYARLVQTVHRQWDAMQVSPADLVLTEVENQALVQQLQAAEQAYVQSLAELRKQLGIPELAGSLVPAGTLRLPSGPDPNFRQQGSEADLVRISFQGHPRIRKARAQAAASRAALCLARAERIPVPSVGPVYENDETGTSFYGFGLSAPLPLLNTGKTLVGQREMEYRRDLVRVKQLRAEIAAQVQASLAKWNRTRALVDQTLESSKTIEAQTERMQRLYQAGQTDLLKLLQVRQRLIEAENVRLDMIWQSTQAYADLLAATGATPLFAPPRAAGMTPRPHDTPLP